MKDIGTGSTSASTREPTSIFLSCRGRLLGPTVVTTGSVKLPSNRSMRPPGPSSANSSTVAGNLFPCTDTNQSWVIMPSWWSNAHELQSIYCTKMPILSFNMLGLGVTSRKECFSKRSPWLSTLKKLPDTSKWDQPNDLVVNNSVPWTDGLQDNHRCTAHIPLSRLVSLMGILHLEIIITSWCKAYGIALIQKRKHLEQ